MRQARGGTEQFAELFSCFTGIVNGVQECVRRPDEGRYVMFAGLGSGTEPQRHGQGIGISRAHALLAALGETVERYAMHDELDAERIIVNTARELGDIAVRPSRFALFDDSQYEMAGFPFARFTEDTRIAWIAGFRVCDRQECWIPLDAVARLGATARRGVAHVMPWTSSGLACHVTADDAVMSGLLEVIERDAFSVTWYNRLSLPLIADADTAAERVQFALRSLPTGATVTAVDLSGLHQVATVMAVIRTRPPDPVGFTIGLGCRRTPEEAYIHAIGEACMSRRWFGVEPSGQHVVGDADSVVTPFQHGQLYLDRARERLTLFLDAGERYVGFGDMPRIEAREASAALADLVVRVGASGGSVFAVDMTPPDVRRAGLAVMKVVCPELQPLDLAHRTRHLGSARLRDWPVRLGLRSRPLELADLNPEPHPFA